MFLLGYQKPRLPSHYYVLVEPPDSAGEEVLRFVSECRRVKLKGRSFREFHQRVVPLLDGEHTLAEIEAEVADVFDPADLEESLALLAEHRLLEDAATSTIPAAARARLAPQLGFFHEVSPAPAELQDRLTRASVTILGLGGAGAHAAVALAAAGVGTLRCVDTAATGPADPYLAGAFAGADVGTPRVEAVRRRIGAVAPEVTVATSDAPLATDDDVQAAVAGSDLVLCCVDPAQVSLAYKLNRVALRTGIRWSSCATSALRVVVGPTVYPGETACYLCYKMRAVAGADNPEDEFAFQRFLDGRKADDSGRRENLVFAAGIAGHSLGLEALKVLTGAFAPSARGSILVVDMLDLSATRHVVLRKPWCPACAASGGGSAPTSAPQANEPTRS